MKRAWSEAGLVMMNVRQRMLTPLSAVRLAEALEEEAAVASLQERGPNLGLVLDLSVTSFDRRVCLICSKGEYLPMPPKVALQVADMLRTNANMAGYGMRITVEGL